MLSNVHRIQRLQVEVYACNINGKFESILPDSFTDCNSYSNGVFCLKL